MIVAVWGGVSVPSFFGQDEPQAHFPQRDRLVRRKANALSTPVSQAHRMQRPAPRAAGHHGDTEKPSAQLGSSARDAPPPSTVASYLGISDKIHGTASNRSLRLDGRDKAVPPSSREQEDEVIRKAEAILPKRVMHAGPSTSICLSTKLISTRTVTSRACALPRSLNPCASSKSS